MRPLVSVCVPTYNGEAYVRECLESVMAQTFRDFELLLVDDASSDSTAAILRRYLGKDPRVRLHLNPRRLGLVGNWNRCVDLARGEWVKFLFQDDYLRPSCLARMLGEAGWGEAMIVCRRSARFEAGISPDVRRLYLRHFSQHSLPRRFPRRRRIPARAFARLMLRYPGYNCIGEPTAVLLHRSAFERYGRFDSRLVSLCDWEFLARVAVNAGLRYIDESLAVFRVHPRAESAFNRTHRLYQAEVLDELVIRHELAYAPAFAPVREAARRESTALGGGPRPNDSGRRHFLADGLGHASARYRAVAVGLFRERLRRGDLPREDGNPR